MTFEHGNNLAETQAQRLENVSEQLTLLLQQPDVAERLRTAAGEAEWSAMEILGHLVEVIPYWLSQCRVVINAAEPPVFGRPLDAPDRLAGPTQGITATTEELLKQWQANVKTAAQTIRQMSAAEWNMKGKHVVRGEMTIAEMVDFFIVAHSEGHLQQIKDVLQE